MIDKRRVTEIIYKAIDEINLLLEGETIKKSLDGPLFGDSGVLDSLGLINLLIATEERIESDLGVAVILAEELDFTADNNPFTTVGKFIDYVYLRTEDKSEGSF